jgi:hypothetical protein
MAMPSNHARNSSHAPSEMAICKDTIMIRDRPHERAVEVTVIYPEGANVLNVQEFAEKGWRSVNKQITIGNVTIKVRGFGR